MPAQPPVHIVVDRHGRQIDAGSIVRQLLRIEREEPDWTHPETCTHLAELAGKLIAATGRTDAPVELIDRMRHHVSRAFRAHLLNVWGMVAAECD